MIAGGRRSQPSLKARALRLLSQREHSRVELLRKLAPHADSAQSVDALLDELGRAGLLSEQRFAESLVRRRAARYGIRRIEQELGTHRLQAAVTGPVLTQLRDGERERALHAWRKRFGAAALDASERARQQRFLAQRGFDADTIAWVIRHGASAPDGG